MESAFELLGSGRSVSLRYSCKILMPDSAPQMLGPISVKRLWNCNKEAELDSGACETSKLLRNDVLEAQGVSVISSRP